MMRIALGFGVLAASCSAALSQPEFEPTPDERKAMFQRMLDLFEDEMPMTMLYNPVAAYGMSKDVRWNPYVQFYMDFRPSNFSIGSRS